jgi:hypothetical protein
VRSSGLPTVAAPSFSDEPPHNDHVRETYPIVEHSSSPLGTLYKLLMGVVQENDPLDHPKSPTIQRRLLELGVYLRARIYHLRDYFATS